MIQVRFVSYQYNRWMRAIERLKTIARLQEDNLPRLMSIDYIDLIRRNITQGKYSPTYTPYNKRYRDWKYLVYGSSGGFWYLAGDLLTSLVSQKSGKRWFGGIPAGVMDRGGKSWLGKGDKGRPVPIAQYGNWMEYGRRNQPSRPLFRPTLGEYADGGALQRLDESRARIRDGWR